LLLFQQKNWESLEKGIPSADSTNFVNFLENLAKFSMSQFLLKKICSECAIMCFSLSYYSVNLGSTGMNPHGFTHYTCDNKLCKYQKDKYMFFYNSENVIYISFFLISQLFHSTLAVLALIILFEDMFKFSKNVFIKRIINCEVK
jgi:hypothetical protein